MLRKSEHLRHGENVRFGSLADILAVNCDVCFTSKSDIRKCWRHVRFVPKADISGLFDHFVGALLKLQGHVNAQRLRGLEIDHQLETGGSHHR
jgi:hypothetical protein